MYSCASELLIVTNDVFLKSFQPFNELGTFHPQAQERVPISGILYRNLPTCIKKSSHAEWVRWDWRVKLFRNSIPVRRLVTGDVGKAHDSNQCSAVSLMIMKHSQVLREAALHFCQHLKPSLLLLCIESEWFCHNNRSEGKYICCKHPCNIIVHHIIIPEVLHAS